MKHYIFYSGDGFTQDDDSNDVDNCQVLGWSSGETPEEAFETLKKEVSIKGFENICCQELKRQKSFYF